MLFFVCFESIMKREKWFGEFGKALQDSPPIPFNKQVWIQITDVSSNVNQ